jgi:hypothetical protein
MCEQRKSSKACVDDMVGKKDNNDSPLSDHLLNLISNHQRDQFETFKNQLIR